MSWAAMLAVAGGGLVVGFVIGEVYFRVMRRRYRRTLRLDAARGLETPPFDQFVNGAPPRRRLPRSKVLRRFRFK